MRTAPRMTPPSRMTLHVARSTWVVGKRSGREVTTVKIPPRLPAHRSGPGTTTCRAYMWPRPGGSCRCTKVGVPFCTPLLVRGLSQPHAPDHAWRGSGSKGTRRPDQRQARNTKSRRARWTPPARPLPGRPPQPRQEPCRGNLPHTNKAATLEPKSFEALNHIRTKAWEAPPWWHADLCED